ncbi:MAG: hypothetical protein A2X03_10015 [Bacteroidetes bacterium GWA2_40_15]|nr:MAG: hypothetical protein A2X03_10015 [Bacteroidetes bacterium GWA2_40_15]
MMTTGYVKILLIPVLLFTVSTLALAQESAQSDKTKLNAGCTFSLNSNGISSIPSFSLGAPAIIAAPSFTLGRFNYEPVLAYDLDIQPWFIDNWFRYKIIDKPRFEFRTGVNFSMYFSDYKLPDETVLQGQRYWVAEFTAIYKPSSASYLSGACWIDRGQDAGTIDGLYFSIMGERSEIGIGKSFLLAANLHLFYIDYNGNNDGLFISPKLTTSLKNKPFALFFHVIQAITGNITPFPGFSWNMGIAYSL